MIKNSNVRTNGNGQVQWTVPVKKEGKRVGGVGFLVFFVVHTIILASMFAFRYLGLISDHIFATFAAVISLEAIYIASFNKIWVNKSSDKLKVMEGEMAEYRDYTMDMAKIHREFLYFGHQIKSIQTDLEMLKKAGIFKLSGNGHHKRLHV